MLYTERNRPRPTELQYYLPELVRRRIFLCLEDRSESRFEEMLSAVARDLLKRYGQLRASAYEAVRVSDHPAIEHFFRCEDELALDFIECCFRQPPYDTGSKAIEDINAIFLQEGIGYELTPLVCREVEKEPTLFGRKRSKTLEMDYPQIIRRDHQALHEAVVHPIIHILTDKRLRVANDEMLKSFSALREKRWEDAMTLAGSAFESFLKTVCHVKGWAFDPNKDTTRTLVVICKDNGLFEPFYASALEAVGTIRNRLSDAHGRGPHGTATPVTQSHAKHLVHLVASHMLFLAELAGLA